MPKRDTVILILIKAAERRKVQAGMNRGYHGNCGKRA
jgi:hypothetical protein